ncbi:MAG: GTP-binding protein [Hyphomicrobiales bacterium]|nr:MAG: GTP-binding protein [Hyphomicrobiales bacterium]
MDRPTLAAPLDAGFTLLTGLMDAARIIPDRLKAKDNSLPLTILSGFLGAGKTTLVNRLLTEPEGRRIVVLVNDFGSLDIDARLIRSRSSTTISLANGCACCTVAGDLSRALVEIAQSEALPDAILLEASGLADPRGIAQVALANPALRLDGIVTMVDAETVVQYAQEPEIAALFTSQVSAADLLILNKVDLVGDAIAGARAAVAALAADKPVIQTAQASVPPAIVFGITTPHDAGILGRGEAGHPDAFRSWNLTWTGQLPGAALRKALSSLPHGVLRAKGILHLDDEEAPHVYQRVGQRWSLRPAEPGVAADALSRLVIIGHRGEAEEISAAVERLKNA